jgi:hypothetical protein
MVVFSLQTFINTFFYVQSSGRARRAALAGWPRRTASAGLKKRTAAGGRPLCPTVGGAVVEAVRWLRLPTATGRPCCPPGGRPWGAADAGRLDT